MSNIIIMLNSSSALLPDPSKPLMALDPDASEVTASVPSSNLLSRITELNTDGIKEMLNDICSKGQSTRRRVTPSAVPVLSQPLARLPYTVFRMNVLVMVLLMRRCRFSKNMDVELSRNIFVWGI